ncbi:MAG: hypothetical protein ACR2IV_19965 [Bryobacteraceae bacterium]
MTSRQVRRAAERATRKQERKAANGFVFSPAENHPFRNLPITLPSPERAGLSMPLARIPEQPREGSISPSQLAANRANAQLSSGPKTSEGKAKSCLNAVKTGLTGRTVLLRAEDAARYEQHVCEFFAELQPVGPRETELVRSLADTSWRLARIPALEMTIFAHGRIQFASQFADREPALQSCLIEMHTFLHYEKQLCNLHIQEGRLRRQREKDTAELRQLQQDRRNTEKHDLQMLAGLYVAAKKDGKPFDPAQYGFEFSIDDIENYLEGIRAAKATRDLMKGDMKPYRSIGNAA